MGVRINKAIGWAMPCAADPLDRESELTSAPLSAHGVWLGDRAAAIVDVEAREEFEFDTAADVLLEEDSLTVGDCAIWAEQLGGGTLIVLPPESAGSWHRRDDDLDFTFDEAQADRLEYMNWGLHSHAGIWMDSITGLQLNQHALTLMRLVQRDAVGADREMDERLIRLIRVTGTEEPVYRDADEALARIGPMVPASVRCLATHLGLFTDPAEVLKLRPARAIWWE